jgi:hypothetical protein
LQKRFPDDTAVRFNYLPTLHAQLFLNASDRSSDRLPERSPENLAKAVQALAVAAPYELGIPGNTTFWTNLYPQFKMSGEWRSSNRSSGGQTLDDIRYVIFTYDYNFVGR